MDMRTDGTKQKKKFPLFDIALLLLLAIAVTFGFYWSAHHRQIKTAEIEYTVRFENVDNAYGGAFAEGKHLYTQQGSAMGSILTAVHSRATEQTFDSTCAYSEGTEYVYETVSLSGKSDVLITVRVTVEVRNGGFFVNGNRIASGMEVDAMVEGYMGHGTILTVKKAEASVPASEVSE